MRQVYDKRILRAVLCFALCASVVVAGLFVSAQVAHAETISEKQAEADELMASIDSLQTMLNDANAEYDRATLEHERASEAADSAAICLKEANLRVDGLQEQLALCAASMYKSGGTASMLEVLIGASSFEEFVALWDSFERITEQEAGLIQESKEACALAEAAEKELAEQEAKAEEEAENAKAARDEIAAAKDELDEELKRVNEDIVMLRAKEESERLSLIHI